MSPTINFQEGDNECTIELFYSFLLKQRVFQISSQNKNILYIFYTLMKTSKEIRDLFIQIREDHLSRERYKTLREHLDKVIRGCPIGIVLEDLQKHLLSFLEDIYFPAALLGMDDNQYDWWKNNMLKQGFYGLLDRNGALLRALALLGNVCSFSH